MEQNKQQTAVDWLFEQIPAEWSSSKSAFDAYQQAKEMEKQQIEDAYIMGSYDMAANEFRPNEYYNDIYGISQKK
jgi:hypothetical protein